MTRPATFLFDIGNVILEVDFLSSLRRLLPASTSESAVMTRLLARKDDLESGSIDNETYVDWARALIDPQLTREDFIHAWTDVFRPVDAMCQSIHALADAGHQLILFSNTNDLHASHSFSRYPVFARFHGAVFSHLVGAMKPHPAIYRHAIQRFALDPSRTLYVDDLADNVATGREMGFRAWQYDLRDHAAFERWLGATLAALP